MDGGFAEYVLAAAEFSYRLPDALDGLDAAPLLCAGIIGYRCLRQTGLETWRGARLGIYGFGAVLAEAVLGVKTHIETFSFAQANEALIRLKHDGVRGAAVLLVGEAGRS